MAKIKIEIPERSIAKYSIPVRITDINYGNHVGNDSFVSIIHEARMKWLSAAGFTELAIDGTGMIMAGLSIEFKAESLYGDIIEAELFRGEVGSVRFELYYRLSTNRQGETIILANAITIMVSYDYNQSKPIAISAALRKMLD